MVGQLMNVNFLAHLIDLPKIEAVDGLDLGMQPDLIFIQSYPTLY